MKKWTLLVAGSFMVMNAYASELTCGYKDYFHLSSDSHPGLVILNGYSDSDVFLQILSPRSFILRDGYCRNGYAQVIIGYDDTHICTIEIKDGPYMNHPKVNSSCVGINYGGTTYDGMGSYSYTVKLK